MVRICAKCLQTKDSTEFYQKVPGRLDTKCKVCHKSGCRSRYQKNRKSDARQPKVIIEPPQENLGQPKVIIEPKKDKNNGGSQSVVDCKIWEEMYNRKLTDIEKAEIKFNVLRFLSVLDEIYQSGELT